VVRRVVYARIVGLRMAGGSEAMIRTAKRRHGRVGKL
jgi:hypothetical protein